MSSATGLSSALPSKHFSTIVDEYSRRRLFLIERAPPTTAHAKTKVHHRVTITPALSLACYSIYRIPHPPLPCYSVLCRCSTQHSAAWCPGSARPPRSAERELLGSSQLDRWIRNGVSNPLVHLARSTANLLCYMYARSCCSRSDSVISLNFTMNDRARCSTDWDR